MTGAAFALSRLGQAAERYAAQGWHVFPLTPRAKTPLLKGAGGFLSATTDREQIRAWWRQHPTANIGLWPGQSGLVVLDIDGPNGEKAAQSLGVFAEPTLICTTGRPDGGRHLYFRRPDFSVSNCDLAENFEVRGDAGYVVAPPSVHPSGTPYRWIGRADEIRDLPPRVLEVLRAAQSGAATKTEGQRAAARALVFTEIGEGGRNNALTRYAGRLIAHGIPEDEALVMLSAMNAQHCQPPLPQHEVNACVANIAARERQKAAMRIVGADEAPADPVPDFGTLAAEQITAAKALNRRDVTDAPTWGWVDLRQMAGPMLPGELVVVGASTGNGKSTLLMSQMDYLAESHVATLYVPLEVDPEACRWRWACWKLGLDFVHVARGEWSKLPEGSQESIDCVLDEQAQNPFVHFATPKRITIGELALWCRRGVEEHGVRCIMLDHFHRMDFGADAKVMRVSVTEVARRLKDLARELNVALVAAAQFNRNGDKLDPYLPPAIDRLKESSGIGEEADHVYMLSRRLRPDVSGEEIKALRLGHTSERDLMDPNTMAVTCRKHRLDDSARDRTILLGVHGGKVQNRAHSWRY
jgi:hypothetical protein